MKDRTSKQSSLFCFICTYFCFVLTLRSRLRLGFVVFMGMKADNHLSLDILKTFLFTPIILTYIIDLTECLTSALMDNMQSICQISSTYIDVKLTHRENKGKYCKLLRSELNIKVCISLK